MDEDIVRCSVCDKEDDGTFNCYPYSETVLCHTPSCWELEENLRRFAPFLFFGDQSRETNK